MGPGPDLQFSVKKCRSNANLDGPKNMDANPERSHLHQYQGF